MKPLRGKIVSEKSGLSENRKCGGIFWRYLMDIFEKVKDLIAEQLDVDDKESISQDSSITDDLGADSLDVVDLVMAIEDEFSVEIPEDQVENIKTVGDIVKYIEDNQ